MTETFVYRVPETIHFGNGAVEEVKNEAVKLGTKALIITDQIMEKVGYVSDCRKLLEEVKIKAAVFAGVISEPNDQFVRDALEVFRFEQCDFVISLGGGSCIDTAKAVAVLATNEINIGMFLDDPTLLAETPVPHIAIPTTAGTGSEVTDVTVITRLDTEVKVMIKTPAIIPTVAISDPLLTKTCPKSIIAGTGVDAFCHAFEAFISKKANKMTDIFALSAMELIVNNLQASYENIEDIEAKNKMALGSLKAGIAFSNASVCLIHGMSRPIGALFKVPHGISNAMLLPVVMAFTKEHAIEKMAVLGNIFEPDAYGKTDEQLADIAVENVSQLLKALQIPNFNTWGIQRESFLLHIDKMIQDAFLSGSPGNHPIVPTKEEVRELYLQAYDYEITM